MLRWFRRTYPSYNLQPLLLKRYRELEEARAFNNWLGERRQAQEGQRHLDDVSRLTEAVHRQVPQLRYARAERRGVERAAGEVAQQQMKTLRAHGFNQRPRFEQVVGYLERNEPLLDQPDRKATSFVTSHFYLDDFVQSSEDPNPQPLQHTPLQAIPEEGFRTPAEATDEDVRLARRYQGYGGTRFVEDDLAGDPEAGALASNGQGPPSITDRLRGTADGAQAAADLIGAGAAGLAAAQAFRSQLPQDAAEYVRLNVLPRPGPAQPPPQIIGRPSDVERLLDEAGQRAQEVVLGGPGRRSSSTGAHRGRGCWNVGWRGGSWRGGNGGVGRARPRRTSGPPTT